MNTKHTLSKIINSIRVQKTYAICPYTKLIYKILILLKQYCIQNIYILGNWILIYFSYKKKNLKFKFFNKTDKRNFLKYIQLKKLTRKHKHGLIFTSKGICNLNHALRLKQGGILFCLIYYSN